MSYSAAVFPVYSCCGLVLHLQYYCRSCMTKCPTFRLHRPSSGFVVVAVSVVVIFGTGTCCCSKLLHTTTTFRVVWRILTWNAMRRMPVVSGTYDGAGAPLMRVVVVAACSSKVMLLFLRIKPTGIPTKRKTGGQLGCPTPSGLSRGELYLNQGSHIPHERALLAWVHVAWRNILE